MMPHVNINILDRPLIDWDLKLVMEPPTLFGALVGANLNKVFSETILAIMLVILLSFTAYSTFSKSITMCRTETLTMIDKELKESLIDKNKQTSTPNNSSSSSCNDEEEACDFIPTDAEDNISGSLESIIERERYAKPRNVVLVAFTFLVVTTPNILKGGGGY